MLKKLIMAVAIIGLSTSVVFAQGAGKAVDASGVSVTEGGNVSLDFREADIRNVLKILAFKSGVNIVASPDVTGVVSIQLNDVPWKQALEVILETYGYVYERKGNIVTVTTVEDLKKRRENAMLLREQEPVTTETFTLNFAKASDVIDSLNKMKSDRGSINFDTRTNMLIVTDVAGKIELMASVIEKLDVTTPQVLIEAKIVETTFTDSENLGIDWLVQATASGSQRATTWPFTQSSENKFAQDDFQGIDDEDFSYGTLNFTQVQAVFELLKSKSETNILSNPRIVTLDNQAAQITVGSQYPIPSYTYNEEQARLQVSGWEYKDIGIIFDVTPHVSQAGFVTLDVEPKITAILDFVTVENTSLPRLSNESALTTVMVEDGNTLVIAGLITSQTTDTKKKTPILGDIPILGVVFQKSEKAVTKTDIMLFITPHIVTPEVSS